MNKNEKAYASHLRGRGVFSGVATALVTPFTDTGIDFSALTESIDFQISEGVRTLVLCGTTGEAPTVTEYERERMICTCAEHINGRATLIVGTGGPDTEKALRYSRFAATHGADALLVVTPYYNKGTHDGVLTYYNRIAEILPTRVYNVPSRSGSDISVSQLKALSQNENIIGVKEASASIEKSARILCELGDVLPLYSGNDDLTLPQLALGASGVISVASNIIPAQMQRLCESFFAGDIEESRSIHEKYYRLMKLLFAETNPTPVKCAMAMMGKCKNILRLPLTVAECDTECALREELERLCLI